MRKKCVWEKIGDGDTSGVYKLHESRGFVAYTDVIPFLN